MISDIVSFVKEATEIRQAGKMENKLALKDAQEAQTSITNAIAVLEAFYKESGEIKKEPWEFIQKPAAGAPKGTWSSKGAMYTGVGGGGAGIISQLETVLSSFSKMEAETRSQEVQDQEEYEKSMNDSKIRKAEKTQEVEMKTAEKARHVEKINSLEGQRKDTAGELEKTMTYIGDLSPACFG